MTVDRRIVDAAKAIGQSAHKRAIFDRVYYHKQRIKTVDEIAVATGLTREQVLKCGVDLKKKKVFGQVKKDGVTAYEQIEFIQTHKADIIRFVENPDKLKQAMQTAAQPIVQTVSHPFSKPRKPKSESQKPKSRYGTGGAKLRIAFLTTNPDASARIRTDIEIRDVLQKIKSSPNRELVEVRHIPAAQVSDVLDALNEFQPHIIHFSGHGGDEGLLFDNRSVEEDGGWAVDFEAVNGIVSATAHPPRLLVFNACDTVDGADVFLETVPMVVAMSDSILDAAATMFAVTFYAAIVIGQPVDKALKQGRAMLKAMKVDGADLPTLIASPDIDASSETFL